MRRRLCLAFTAASLCAALAPAQTTGSIGGWIVDPSGAPLPGVAVEASGANLQRRRSTVTQRDGTYRLPALPPGRYTLHTSLPGFASVERAVTVTADSTSIARVILQLALSEKVSVSGESSFVDMTSTTTGTSYDARLLIHLPVDRNYADGIKTTPGVIQDLGDTQGRSLALAINGATSAENQWIIDGINTTSVLKGVQGKAINNEFVEEVEVKTGGYQAEYGRALGGVINVVTKSGGNAFHGDGFVYYDSSALSAKREFAEGVDSSASGMRLADYRRTDYGIDLGGYLLRDRLWFFGAYDRTEFPAKVSRYVSSEQVPDTLEFPLNGIDNLYSVKLTWSAAGGSTLVATVFGDPTTNSGAGAADPRQGAFRVPLVTNPDPGTWESRRSIGATDYGLRFNQVFGSSGLFTLQAARHQDRYELTPAGAGLAVRLADFSCQGGNSLRPCQIPPEPNSVEGGLGQLGGSSNNSSSRRDQIRADANLYRGPHDLKGGADYQNARSNSLGLYSGGQQVYRFNEYGTTYYLHQFYTLDPYNPTPSAADWVASAQEIGVYVQDSWRAAPGLTINAGLRWDEERIRDREGNTRIPLKGEWQPRLGVVWDPWRDGATKLYAFAGRFYHSLPLDLAARSWGGPLASNTYNFDPVDLAPADVYGHSSSIPGLPIPAPAGEGPPVDAGLKGISLDEFTVGAERLLGQTLSLGVKATYRRLHNTIEDRCDLDPFTPGSTGGCAYINPGSSSQYARGAFFHCTGLDSSDNCTADPATYFRLHGTAAVPPARRLYRGIELLARKSFSERLWFQASYVFSSLRGNYDGLVSEGFSGVTSPGLNPDFDWPALYHNGYGRLYLDRPHDLRLTGFYTTPFRLSGGIEAWVVSGAPLNKLGYLNQNYSHHIQLVPRGSAGRLPTSWDAHLTLEYPVRVGPTTVTLQSYLYNIFNNQIRTDQDTVWSNQRPEGYPDSILDPNQKQTNPNYGKVTRRQSPRLLRAAVRVSF